MSEIRNLGSHFSILFCFKSKKRFGLVINRFLVVIHITIMLISCKTGDKISDKKILRYNSATGITSLDPAFARTQENIRTVNQLFNGLVELDESLKVRPSIAKRWEVSDDKKVYTFILNKQVLFHNDTVFGGRKRTVTAYDFVYSFNRIIQPKTASDGAWIFNGIVAQYEPFSATNDSTFILKLKKPFSPLLSMLTMAYCYVVPKEAVDYYAEDFSKHPVGTGPFQFSNWAPGVKLNLIRNQNYFQHTIGNIDAISVSFIQSKQTELLEFIQGKLDLFSGLESSFKDEILTGDGELKAKYKDKIVLHTFPFLNTEYLAFNLEMKNTPLQDLNYRKALYHAIDRDAMIKYLRNGVGKPANGGFSPIGLPAHYPYGKKGYDPELARLYLAKVAVDLTIPLTLTTTSDYLDLCILVQKNCAEVGIPIRLDVVPSSLLKQQKSAGELAFFRSSWIADYPDGENYLACFYSSNKAPNGPNYTRYESPTFDKAYQTLLGEENENRDSLFEAMEKELRNQQAFIPLFYDESVWLISQKIRGIEINSLNHLILKNTQMDE